MKQPLIRVIDKNFESKLLITTYKSLQFERSLFGVGMFELHLNPNDELLSGLIVDNIIFFDEIHVGIIKSTTAEIDKSGLSLIVKGEQLKGIANRRITVPDSRSDGGYYGYVRYPDTGTPDVPAETIYHSFMHSQVISPEDNLRKIPQITMKENRQRGINMRWSSRFEPLDTVFKEIGEYSAMGYDVTLDLSAKRFVFDVIEKKDKTRGSEKPIIFSTDFGNVSDISYKVDNKDFYNSGYAGGAGEDENRFIQTVYPDGNLYSGIERRELWVDCGSIENPDDLVFEGRYKMTRNVQSQSIDVNVLNAGAFEYLKDWDIGDVVTIRSKQLKVEMNNQITAVKEVYEKNKSSISVTFGVKAKNVLDEIRKIEVVR